MTDDVMKMLEKVRAEKARKQQAAPWRFHGEGDQEPTAWLVKGILPETGAGLIAGQWGSYKTTIGLDIAVSVMAEVPFAGRFRVKRRGGVCYIAAEGFGGLGSRLTAAAEARGVAGALPFAFRSDCPPLTAPDALDRLVALVDAAADQIAGKFELPLALIEIDTVITTAGYSKSGDDNDAATAQRVMTVLSGLSQRTGALVIGIDHFGKVVETGTRGSSAKEAHADVVLALLADRELSGAVTNTRLAIRKHREGVSGLELPFAPKVIEIGTDEDGDPITRVVIDWNAPASPPAEAGWSKSLQLLRRILMTTLADGADIRPFLDGPTVRAVGVNAVRAEFGKQYVVDGDDRQKADARRHAFLRAMEAAQGKGLVMVREINGAQMVWLTRRTTEDGRTDA
jgi:AAA domain